MSKVIALCSPKSGGGASACAVSLARSLCAKGSKVLLADFAHHGGALQYLLDLPQPLKTEDAEPAETVLPNLFAVSAGQAADDCAGALAKWRASSFDEIILDLPSAHFDEASMFFLKADLPILIADPEPVSLSFLVRWIRHAINRHMASNSGDAGIIQEIAAHSKTWEFDDIYPKLSPNQQNAFVRALAAFRCAFVLNRRRDNSESLQCAALCHALGMIFGVDVAYLGAMSYDDRRWFYERRLGDVSLFAREDPMTREWGDIIRNLPQAFEFYANEHDCLPLVRVQQKPRQFLRATAAAGARQAYRCLWEGYCRDRGLVSMIVKPEKKAQILTLLEAAWRRADYDEAAAPAGSEAGYISGEMQAVTRCVSDAFAAVKRCDVNPSLPDAGAFLKKRRAEFQLSVLQLAIRTRVPQKIIELIEAQNTDDISPPRLQAYLFEIAKALDLSFDDVKRKFGL